MVDKILILCVLSWMCCVECKLNLRTGALCTGADGVRGKCVNLYKCPSAVVTYLHYNFGHDVLTDFPEVCNENGPEPAVCCTDYYIDEEERSRGLALDRYGELVNLRERPLAKAVCLTYFQELPYQCKVNVKRELIRLNTYLAENETGHHYHGSAPTAGGGIDARIREFPHAALLGYGEDVESAQWLCGGTVISEEYILTAGHCLSSPAQGPVKFVSLGVLRRSDPVETWQIHTVRRAIPHPDYQPPSRYNDIALLQLNDNIKFSPDVLPACLQTFDGTFSSVQGIGWGRLGYRQSLADTLQVVKLQSFEDEKCAELFPPHRRLRNGYNKTTQICYGSPKNIMDTCEGDSGGPVHVDYHQCQYTVAGVTSFGRDCGIEAGAGVYTRVQPYLGWIERIVWPYFAIVNNVFDD